jgi:hypothetical protein
MKPADFSLLPFSAAGIPPAMKITGSAAREDGRFLVRYELRPASEIAVPALTDAPARRDRLWEETCFELFIGPEDSDYYWEFNLSPTGDWNVYRFSTYRQGMQEEPAFASLPFSVEVRSDLLRLCLEHDLTAIVHGDRTLNAGIAAVVCLADGTLTYWALTHPAPAPDFHRRDGFILEL